MSENTHKQQIIDAALEGLHQGGFSKEYAYLFEKLLDRVYTSGYSEGKWSGQQEQYLVNLGSQIYTSRG
jgi:hypothetical protein